MGRHVLRIVFELAPKPLPVDEVSIALAREQIVRRLLHVVFKNLVVEDPTVELTLKLAREGRPIRAYRFESSEREAYLVASAHEPRVAFLTA